MAVAVLITDVQQPTQLLPWAASFALARKTQLLVIIPRRATGQTTWKTLDLSQDDSAIGQAIVPVASELGLCYLEESVSETADPCPLQVRQLSAPNPGWALVQEVNRLDITLLIIPAPTGKAIGDEGNWQRRLYGNAPCQTMYLRDDQHQLLANAKLLVAVTQDEDSVAIRCAAELVRQNDGALTAIYVGRSVDEVSHVVGQRTLQRVLSKSLGLKSHTSVEQDVVLADSLVEGICRYGVADFELILYDGRGQREVRRLLDNNLFPGVVPSSIPALGIVRGAVPLSNRIVRRMESLAVRMVPQLEREQRISLVERIQSSSNWDFDFIALICLATSIAGLGLIDNSPAVIIGAMLVAPLMTPIIGTGLALAQGNGKLIQSTLRTIAFAFVLSFLIGVLVLGPCSAGLTEQMEQRGSPGTLHLLVGFLSGIAAAYATGQPNLLSALPGVAIAAALVPPLATAGIAVWYGDQGSRVALGALGLFGANMLAIVVGTALTFWLVGIRPTKKDKKSQSWPVWLFIALIFLTIGLAIGMSRRRILKRFFACSPTSTLVCGESARQELQVHVDHVFE